MPDEYSLQHSVMARYVNCLSDHGVECDNYDQLWEWSVTHPEFWTSIAEFFEVKYEGSLEPKLIGNQMPDVSWFPKATLNFAEHLLSGPPKSIAVIDVDERDNERTVTYEELAQLVGGVQRGLKNLGVSEGDRVVALLPNRLEALVAFVACAGLGAIWSSCSPEFGTQSIVDRFAQLSPSVLLVVDHYEYGGRRFDMRRSVALLKEKLPTVREVVVFSDGLANEFMDGAKPWSIFDDSGSPEFKRVGFSHPLWVLYSSGTTGLPKGIVHGHGGILLESLKQIRLHMDLGPDDRLFWYTTTGWMMWNVVISGLLSKGSIVLYDGSPTYPDSLRLWRMVEKYEMTFFGAGAGYFDRGMRDGLSPGQECDLSSLRAIGSTGSPLSPEGFRWIYGSARSDIPVFSLSGGTDICTSLLSSSRLLPVYAGVLQCRALGVAASAFDSDGRSVVGQMGELVVTEPMPSMPLGLWGDETGERYRNAYFKPFPGVWRHGDWVTFHPDGSAVVHGRSDATLNRGGIRMGSADFYRVVEALPEVTDSLVVEVRGEDTGTQLVLFLVLMGDLQLTEERVKSVRDAIRREISPRHLPDRIVQIPEVPKTLNGKKLEVPVKRILEGVPIGEAVSLGSIANPDSVFFFEKFV
jgi:acetoacetyl-CoA synthetase